MNQLVSNSEKELEVRMLFATVIISGEAGHDEFISKPVWKTLQISPEISSIR
jgi:hypothetical protein